MSNHHIDCIMPAAGLSSRMGHWKMMLPYRNHTILDESIENALTFCTRVILVVGYRSEELIDKFKDKKGVEVIVNAHYTNGMFGSIQQGAKEVETEHFFVCHGDMPCINTSIYRDVWALRGEHIVFPGNPQNSGHPVLLPFSMKEQIVNAPINSKMKRLICGNEVKYAGITTEKIHLDIDNLEAYQKLCQAD